MRFTNLGLQMRAAVESRRLVQLDGINANRVVAVAWAISSLLAGLAGRAPGPQFAQLQSENYITLMVAAIAAAAWGVLRSMPIAASVASCIWAWSSSRPRATCRPAASSTTRCCPVLPMIVLVAALLFVPGMRSLDDTKDPLASVDPPTPPTAATSRAPTDGQDHPGRCGTSFWSASSSRCSPGCPLTWEGVFNQGLAFSIIFLSITLITGMGGQLSLAQATLAGVGAFTAGQLASHLGLSLLVGGVVGAALAAVVAVILALFSLRLKGLGLALMTLGRGARLRRGRVLRRRPINGGQSGLSLQSQVGGTGHLQPQRARAVHRRAWWCWCCVTLAILQIRKGTIGQYLGAMRGSETAAAAGLASTSPGSAS